MSPILVCDNHTVICSLERPFPHAGELGKFDRAVNSASLANQSNTPSDEYIGVMDPTLLPPGSEVLQNANTRLGSRDLLFDHKAEQGQ